MASQSKRNRLQSIPNNPPKVKGGKDDKIGGNSGDPPEAEEPERIPATQADLLAVQLHQAREDKNTLRQQLLANQKQLVGLQTQVGALNQRILQLEMLADDKANTDLRKEHEFELGRSIHKDDETGDIYWLEAAEKK